MKYQYLLSSGTKVILASFFHGAMVHKMQKLSNLEYSVIETDQHWESSSEKTRCLGYFQIQLSGSHLSAEIKEKSPKKVKKGTKVIAFVVKKVRK